MTVIFWTLCLSLTQWTLLFLQFYCKLDSSQNTHTERNPPWISSPVRKPGLFRVHPSHRIAIIQLRRICFVIRAPLLYLCGIVGCGHLLLSPFILSSATQYGSFQCVIGTIIPLFLPLYLCVRRTYDWIRSTSGGSTSEGILVVELRCIRATPLACLTGHDASPNIET